MKRISVFLFSAISLTAFAETESAIDSYNYVSDDINNMVNDVQVVRPINGGTVIIPEFASTCPEEMKGAFSYACKILEEYLPPCLPLRVRVSCGNISPATAISKVTSNTLTNFGNKPYIDAPMSTVKGVILGELGYDSSHTYLDYVNDVNLLTGRPDITITYNSEFIDEFYCSLDTLPENKYDFVSVALRDMLKGLGFTSRFIVNAANNTLTDPRGNLNFFETAIDNALGTTNRYALATSGELSVPFASRSYLKLYARATGRKACR